MPFRFPNLFLVGAPKCGTTWMAACLARHPEIFFSSKKEPLTLATDLTHSKKFDWLSYEALFEDAQNERYVGEGSIWYLYSKSAVQEIARMSPDARIIIMIREPVDMIRSLHRQFVKSGNEPIHQLEAALAAEPERKEGLFRLDVGHFPEGLFYREVVRYSRQISRFVETFGPENVHTIIYNDLVTSPVKTADSVFEFLRLSAIPIDAKPVNVGGSYYTLGSRKFNKHLNAQLDKCQRFRGILPLPLRSGLHNMMQKVSRYDGTIKSETATRLRLQFADERRQLERLLKRDFSMWG